MPPRSLCPEIPRYCFGSWPERLYTYTQLRRLHLKPRDRDIPQGCYFIPTKPYIRYLYDITLTAERRKPTQKQLAAIQQARQVRIQNHTCQRCGYFDKSFGKTTYDEEQVKHNLCFECKETLRAQRRMAAIETFCFTTLQSTTAWCVLDTETTGLETDDEVIELSIINSTGSVLFSSIIQTQDPEREDIATWVHGIDRNMLNTAPTFMNIWPDIEQIIQSHKRIFTYNADFDRRLLTQTALRYGCQVPEIDWHCLMELFSRYYGEWSNYFGSYTWQSLETALAYLSLPANGSHRAEADCQSALAVMKELAKRHEQKQQEQHE